MPSYAHKKLIERIARLDETPTDAAAYNNWLKAGDHLDLLHRNGAEDELIVYASGKLSFIHTAIVSNDKLFPIDGDDLLCWSCNAYDQGVSYVTGDAQDGIWVERGMQNPGSKILEGARQLVFGRVFDGWPDADRAYFEVLQEFAHLAGIHWRPEQRAYCRFDGHGDIEHVVSITVNEDGHSIALVSFKRKLLEHYLAATNSSLIRMFDFTLFRQQFCPPLSDGNEDIKFENDDFFYRQKITDGLAGYSRGIQIIRPSRSNNEINSSRMDDWGGQGDKGYVEFIAHDWRNNQITKISTDPAATTNYFQTNGNSLPYELSPAFFRPDVLLKYKGDRDKYNVGARTIDCRAAWHLRGYDVNEAGQVHAYICYLRNLPYSEQQYWASFNEAPKADISERAISTDFKGEFTHQIDPLQQILSVVRRWGDEKKSWWKLHDQRLLESVGTPHTKSRDEWANAFMDLDKLLIEGFDVKAIRAKLREGQVEFEKDDQSIILLEKLLTGNTETDSGQRLDGLRTVKLIRNKLKGHSSGSDAVNLAQNALKKHETFAAHFIYTCKIVGKELDLIERHFP